MNHRELGKRCTSLGSLLATAATVLLLGVPGHAQQPMTTPVRPSAGPSRPATSPARQPSARYAGVPQRSGHPNLGNASSNILGPDSGAPVPTWELPKNITPHWEIPSYNNVQPNAVQGNPRPRNRNRAAYGVGVPYYSFIDPTGVDSAGNFDNGQFDNGQTDNAAQSGQPEAPGRDTGREQYAPQDQGQFPDGQPGDGSGYPPARAPYRPGRPQPSAQPSTALQNSAANQSDGLDHPEVTLVFNDGRAPKKVRSYVLTGSTILVLENGHQSQIPIADLDVQATMAKNRNAGVDFTLPGGSR